ncbi:hypothetical protein BV22DRAFT_572593 [Leucogyrophana mollusca]|uniref:Uncharacterized protein n=1 Tax=Leucogyrophana mollusca TaxID=85980 RepID=A0ACB8BDL1_9AGAM|nr:hypothetical protein BV22DRAFT_572593 [Leucogyrophana mollusca]
MPISNNSKFRLCRRVRRCVSLMRCSLGSVLRHRRMLQKYSSLQARRSVSGARHFFERLQQFDQRTTSNSSHGKSGPPSHASGTDPSVNGLKGKEAPTAQVDAVRQERAVVGAPPSAVHSPPSASASQNPHSAILFLLLGRHSTAYSVFTTTSVPGGISSLTQANTLSDKGTPHPRPDAPRVVYDMSPSVINSPDGPSPKYPHIAMYSDLLHRFCEPLLWSLRSKLAFR